MKLWALVAISTLAIGVDGRCTSAVADPAKAGSVSDVIADQTEAPPKPLGGNAITQDMEAALKKEGFTDLKILPNSILVRAKDKTGKPVAMILDPNSMTEVVTLDPHSGSAAAGTGAGKPLTGESSFATVLPTARLSSTLVGLRVRGAQGQVVGTIKDLAIDHEGVAAYIIGVGGLLDGVRYVAVAPKALDIGYDAAANAYYAKMNTTSDRLKAAPAFKYEGSFEAGRK